MHYTVEAVEDESWPLKHGTMKFEALDVVCLTPQGNRQRATTNTAGLQAAAPITPWRERRRVAGRCVVERPGGNECRKAAGRSCICKTP